MNANLPQWKDWYFARYTYGGFERAKYPELNEAASAVFGLLQRITVSADEWPHEEQCLGDGGLGPGYGLPSLIIDGLLRETRSRIGSALPMPAICRRRGSRGVLRNLLRVILCSVGFEPPPIAYPSVMYSFRSGAIFRNRDRCVERLKNGLSRVDVGASFLKTVQERPSGRGEGGVEFVARMVSRDLEDDGCSLYCLLVKMSGRPAGRSGWRQRRRLPILPREGLGEFDERKAHLGVLYRQKSLYKAMPFLRVRLV